MLKMLIHAGIGSFELLSATVRSWVV